MTRRVAIVIPTLNEADGIGGLLTQFSREPVDRVVDILVADGGSNDGTRAIVRDAARRDDRIRLIDNPDRIQAAGFNKAAALADREADTLIRIDAHASYPGEYVQMILEAFAESGADMVAVRLDTQGVTARQQGIAAASNSRAGSGGSAHRIGGFSGFVDHGHHAGMDRTMFDLVGGYDESFVANEDAEFDARVRATGGRIWLAGNIGILYYPRRTFSALFWQYLRYGRGRAQTWGKHREALRLRQIAPVVVVVGCTSAFMLAPALPALLLVPAGYIAAISAATLALLRIAPRWSTLLAAPAMIVMHWAWGTGFVAEALKAAFGRQTPRFSVTKGEECQAERLYR